ncbi:MAG: MarR family winged helix-turn-helix transcriptional regulator [Bacillota bacterium]
MDQPFVLAIQELFPRVMRYLEAEEIRELTGLGVTPGQINALLVLYFSDNLTMGDLATEMYLTESACTRLVDRLVKIYLVRRRDDEKDRRVVRVALTSYGRQLAELVNARRQHRFSELAKGLSGDEQDRLISSLRSILRVFKQQEAERNRHEAERAAEAGVQKPKRRANHVKE